MKLRPEILNHGALPLFLHGLNLRKIKGDDWWDITRKKALNEYNQN